jgi:drug/metabolite transporter (DMT)-like permease
MTALAPRWRPYIVLVIGVIAVSFASIFIRFAQEENAPSLVLAAARLWVAALVLTPVALRHHRQELAALRFSDFKWALVSGLVLGVHFAAWITSLEYTAVMNSVVLVTTNPLWVALIAAVFLGERLNRWAIIGLALALSGGVLVSLSGEVGEPATRHAPWLGNGLALIGAIMAAIYFVIGRKLRARLSAILYIWLVYSAAALILTVAVLFSGEQVTGLPAEAYLWMVLMGLIPQLIGHSAFNYVLGFLPAAFVSLAALGEPIGSGILAIIFLGEWPVALQLAGATLILFGIGVSSQSRGVPVPEPAG